MMFAMFFIAEYANMITVSALTATLFFGGWDIPFTSWDNLPPWTVLKTLLTLGAFAAKTGFFLFLFMWVRWTLPRFRYDQLMSLGWSIMLPVALAYIVIIASVTLGLDALGVARGPMFSLALLALNVVLVVILFGWLDRGRLISPASPRVGTSELVRMRARGLERPRFAGTGAAATPLVAGASPLVAAPVASASAALSAGTAGGAD